jgi:hypothetical protein
MERKPSGTWAPMPPPKNQAWEEAIAGKDLDSPVAYDPARGFSLGQVIRHDKFGIGVVMGVKIGNKIIVVFEDRTRILVKGQNTE